MDAAERLFHERGYKSVTMRDIADDLGIRQASLYYHAPGGKEELYVKVLERSLERHHQGLKDAIGGAKEKVQDQLRAVSRWLLSQHPLHLTRILNSDVPLLSEEESEKMAARAQESTLQPVAQIFKDAKKRKEIQSSASPEVVAHAFLSAIDAIRYHAESGNVNKSREKMSDNMIDVFLDGLRPR